MRKKPEKTRRPPTGRGALPRVARSSDLGSGRPRPGRKATVDAETLETAQPVDVLLEHLLDRARTGEASPDDIARSFHALRRGPGEAADGWRRYLAPVKQRIVHLARAGVLEIVRKGIVVPVDEARGLFKVRLADTEPRDDERS